MFPLSFFLYYINNAKYKSRIRKKEISMVDLLQCPQCQHFKLNDEKHKQFYPFCSKRCKLKFENEKFQKFKHNNRCNKHKSQRLSFKGECWNCYKEKFIKKIPIKHIYKFGIFGFKLAPTFRTSKDSWSGDKIAFEQYLIDNKIKWFVYIKFYVNSSGKIKPIVVGKSGSNLVNASGSDLNFSTAIEDGPARQFINLHNFEWCYDAIAIKKVRNEHKAYQVERKIMNLFDLFGS